jgi:signal transduction histidine kinase
LIADKPKPFALPPRARGLESLLPNLTAAPSEPASVLVVDDEEVIRDLFLSLLDPGEFRTAAFPSGEAALAAYQPDSFDLAVIDKNLPGLNGIDLMRELKARDPAIEVILITGYASLQTAIESLQLGAYDYIEKPFVNLDLVVEKFRKAIERRGLTVANQQLLAHLQVTNRKLTERNVQLLEIQEQLLDQLRMAAVGQLAASVGMEITEPLSIIKSNVDLIEERLGPSLQLVEELAHQAATNPELASLRQHLLEAAQASGVSRIELFVEDALQAFREVREEVERLIGLVKGMQLYSHASRSDLGTVDLARCLERAVELVEREQQRRGIELRLDLALDLPSLRGTPHLLTQAFLNLIQNAFEAIRSEGLVEVRARHEPDGVRVTISDTGAGIPRESLAKVLKPFYTSKETERHAGLGLNLAEEILRRHGGRLRLESEPGVGTRVMVTLPVTQLFPR